MRRSTDNRGLTLIETVASMMIFAIVTLGVAPLIASTIRGASLSRSYTLAKNLAQQSMERVRGLPYFESIKGQSPPQRRDVLDLYFPDLGTGYNGASNVWSFTTTCTAASVSPAASGPFGCPPQLSSLGRVPTGYTITFVTQFVRPRLGANPQTYDVIQPPAGYSWSVEATEVPVEPLVLMTVTTSWTYKGQARSYQLKSLIGDRRLSPDQLRANATVDYMVQARTGFRDGLGRDSHALLTAGRSTSGTQILAVSQADQDVRAGEIVLTREAFGDEEGTTLADVSAAAATLTAPPTTNPAPLTSAVAQTVSHPDLSPALQLAYLNASNADTTPPPAIPAPYPAALNPGVQVVDELPTASGNFLFNVGSGLETWWMTNQADGGVSSILKLDSSRKMVVGQATATKMRGSTSATATDVTPSGTRKVESVAHGEFGNIQLLPVTFIGGSDKAVVVIGTFTADLQCTSTGTFSSAIARGTWSTTLSYWKDSTNDGVANGAYQTVALSGSETAAATDPLAAIRTTNPLVYDSAINAADVYLFADAAAGKPNGYLESWSSAPRIATTKSAQRSTADLGGAINLSSVPTDPLNPTTSITVSIGKMSCEAVDKRA